MADQPLTTQLQMLPLWTIHQDLVALDLFAVLLEQLIGFFGKRLGLLDAFPQRGLGFFDLVERLMRLISHLDGSLERAASSSLRR